MLVDRFLERPRVAVTGLAGMIGGRLRDLCVDVIWEPLAVDITDREGVAKAVARTTADTVVNLAAYTDVGSAWKQHGNLEGLCYRVNVAGAENLARAAVAADKRFIQVSTDYVFEGDREEPYAETDQPDARTDWYGFTKRAAEEITRDVAPGAAIMRLSFPYVRESPRKVDFVRRISEQLATGSLPPMFSDQVVTPTFVDDFSLALVEVIRTRAEGVFHAVGPEWMSPADIAVEIASSRGLSASSVRSSSLQAYVEAGGRPFPRSLRLDSAATLRALRTPQTSLRQALRLPGWNAE